MSLFLFDNIKNPAEKKKIINNVLSCMTSTGAGALNEFPRAPKKKNEHFCIAFRMW